MLESVLNYLHNYFEVSRRRGNYTIAQGCLDVDFLLPGQYFRIVGSVLNDGVYEYPVTALRDEAFTGEIWPMAVPRAVVDLSNDIAAYHAANPESGLSSESYGGYSYSRASGENGSPAGWQSVFAQKLSQWRKI